MVMLDGDYYDIDSILAEEEKVPLRFLTEARHIGFLDPTTQTDDLRNESQLELPLWIAAPFALRLFVTIIEPKCFSHRFRTYLLADPTVVNLRERSRFYYESGIRLALFLRNGQAMVETLIKSLASRCGDILDKAQNSRTEDLSLLTSGMTELERKIFQAGHQAALEIYCFKKRATGYVVDQSHTRKRLRMD